MKKPYCIPSSVYRLQFNKQFTFQQAQKVLPYLKELGIEAIYASPFFEASPNSTHGYNITNPHLLNPEIGSEKDTYWQTLKQLGLSQILDVVSNHMGITGNRNLFWRDVLENGPASNYAHFFDIDWHPAKEELKNKVLLPILEDLYGNILEKGMIRLSWIHHRFQFQYRTHLLPLSLHTYPVLLHKIAGSTQNQTEQNKLRRLAREFEKTAQKDSSHRHAQKEKLKKDLEILHQSSKTVQKAIQQTLLRINGKHKLPKSFDFLDDLLNQQVYRLAHWKVASEEINYRRFFDINELAAIQMENKDVFQIYHKYIFQLLKEKKAHGVRIDHPDGLYNPKEYFNRLQKAFQKISDQPLYVILEKILDKNEELSHSWPVAGTVGYDFLNYLNGLFIQRENSKKFEEIYTDFIKTPIDYENLLYQKKKFFALIHMSSEIHSLGHRLDFISEQDRRYRDFTLNNLTLAIRETIACFPVYRTYISPETKKVSKKEAQYIKIAIQKARKKTPALNVAVYDFLEKILLLKWGSSISKEEQELYLDFVLRFQQLTSPVMAKGLEDTLFYAYHYFISLNEVGGDPHYFGISKEDFHRHNLKGKEKWPYRFLATSTHDTKRSEDVRWRLNVLSELPEEWRIHINRWNLVNKKHKTLVDDTFFPEDNTEYFIYQTLVGIWPQQKLTDFSLFQDRAWNYLQKAIREAKTHTNWINPNLVYEEAVKKFIYNILSPDKKNLFLKLFLSFHKRIKHYGMLNSLSAVTLKLGSPGVVDLYQGSELWHLHLVDPDNRQPVDFELRKTTLNKLKSSPFPDPFTLFSQGAIKQFLYWKGLSLRQQYPSLFLEGTYTPLEVVGEKQHHVIAWMRQFEDQIALIVSSRFFTSLTSDTKIFPTGQIWKNNDLILKNHSLPLIFRNIYTNETLSVSKKGTQLIIPLSKIFNQLHTAILTNITYD